MILGLRQENSDKKKPDENSILDLFAQNQILPTFDDDDTETNGADRLWWSIILIPDILFLISYGILFWLLFKLTLEGHIQLSSDTNLPWIKNKGLGYKVLVYGLLGYIALEALMTILYLFNKIEFVHFVLEMSIVVAVA